MKINRHNYEAYLLDQLEGRLSVEDRQELELFLLKNPDCTCENLEFEPWILEDQKLSYPKRELLKKGFPEHSTVLGDHNFDMFSIARMEGDLLEEQIAEHQAMLDANDNKAMEWQQWKQAILPAEQVSFPQKDRLKRKTAGRSRMLWISISAAAAAVTLLIVLFRTETEFPRQENYTQEPQVESPIQAPREELSGRSQDAPVESEAQKELMDPEPLQNTQRIAGTAIQQDNDPIRTSVGADPHMIPPNDKTDHSVPHTEAQLISEDRLQAKAISFSAQQFSAASLLGEVDADQIEPLKIPPTPVNSSKFSLAQISERGIQEIVEDYAEEKDLSLLKIADAGIKGINKLAGSDISLLASRNEEGEVSGFKLKSKRFSFTRPINREE